MLLLGPVLLSHGQAIAPRFVTDGRIGPSRDGVAAVAHDGGYDVSVPGGPAGWPGFSLLPPEGTTWDFSPFGRVEAVVSNSCDSPLHLTLRVDSTGDWRSNPWNAEAVMLKPGEAKTIRVAFGYEYGFKPSEKPFDPNRVKQLLFFLGKSDKDRSFRVGAIQATGAAGDGPPVDPARRVVVPKDGVFIGKGAAEAPATGYLGNAVKIGPKAGFWNLGDWTSVEAELRNTGDTPLSLKVRIDSASANTDPVPVEIATGAKVNVRLPFAAAKPWIGTFDEATGKGGSLPGTGTKFASNRVKALTVIADNPAAVKAVEVVSARAVLDAAELPDWLGRRPPVSGDWEQTLCEEFEGDSVDETRWNVHASNFWDKRTHFTRENAIVANGLLRLRYERKPGFHNDDPANTSSVSNTPWACGILTSYGKWTQLYGYFEARMKLPRAPGLWPAFWTMPDRGADTPGESWRRGDTHDGGMEFDIMEHLTGWGYNRFNIACHWDGYGKEHKALGTCAYLEPDAEGFIVVGLLWLPGHFSVWGNGRELARWENARVASVPAYIIFYMVTGGWDNAPFDPKAMPDDFTIDWFRAWRRKDLPKTY